MYIYIYILVDQRNCSPKSPEFKNNNDVECVACVLVRQPPTRKSNSPTVVHLGHVVQMYCSEVRGSNSTGLSLPMPPTRPRIQPKTLNIPTFLFVAVAGGGGGGEFSNRLNYFSFRGRSQIS